MLLLLVCFSTAKQQLKTSQTPLLWGFEFDNSAQSRYMCWRESIPQNGQWRWACCRPNGPWAVKTIVPSPWDRQWAAMEISCHFGSVWFLFSPSVFGVSVAPDPVCKLWHNPSNLFSSHLCWQFKWDYGMFQVGIWRFSLSVTIQL